MPECSIDADNVGYYPRLFGFVLLIAFVFLDDGSGGGFTSIFVLCASIGSIVSSVFGSGGVRPYVVVGERAT